MSLGLLRRITIGLWLLLCLDGVLLTGRHTLEGARQDIQGAAQATERAAA
jgi:predicted small secreted protein